MKFVAEKTFPNLPCAHQQWFDKDGSNEQFSGACAKFHGYDRSVKFKIEGELDEHGWVFPFGAFKQIRTFLEYYFDHTAVIPADDPRLPAVLEFNKAHKVFDLRVLPYGVSMEMSALFIYEHVQPYVSWVTNERCSIVEVECREHEKNAASLRMSWEEGQAYSMAFYGGPQSLLIARRYGHEVKLPMYAHWAAVKPADALKVIKDKMAASLWTNLCAEMADR